MSSEIKVWNDAHEAPLEPLRISADMEQLGFDWAEKKAAFRILDELRVPLRDDLALRFMSEERGLSRAEAQMRASTSEEYREHVRAMVNAEREANRAFASFRAIQARLDAMRTAEASRRAATYSR